MDWLIEFLRYEVVLIKNYNSIVAYCVNSPIYSSPNECPNSVISLYLVYYLLFADN